MALYKIQLDAAIRLSIVKRGQLAAGKLLKPGGWRLEYRSKRVL
jgi:nitrogen fixation protein